MLFDVVDDKLLLLDRPVFDHSLDNSASVVFVD